MLAIRRRAGAMQPPTGPVPPWCICFHPAPKGPGGKTTPVLRTGERDYFPLAPEGPGKETIREHLAAGNNGAFWVGKIERNMERDRRNVVDLEAMGWTVVRFWGSDVMRDAGACVDKVWVLLDEAGREG